MQHDLPILVDFAVAIVAALLGGILAQRLHLPAIVGYLVAGVIIGPFTPGITGDVHTIQQFAELGVIFLLFGVGLHFSLGDLWAVRSIAVPGALLQMLLTTAGGILLTTIWGWSLVASLVLGLAVSIASTAVLLRSLMDQHLLHTPHGQVAVGWLVLEDLATVLILVLLPAMTNKQGGNAWQIASIALLKALVFAALMLFVGRKIIPWLLSRLVRLFSRELFIIAIVSITIGIAVGASYLFGVSLALGAFLAGIVINESTLSHQVEAEVLPFRDTFAVLFFVSVGMLVNPSYLIHQWVAVVALTLLIVVGKFVLTVLLGMLFSRSGRTTLVVAAGLCQIGEFSFILGQTGLSLGMFSRNQYSLLLAGALLSITANPFVFRILPWMEARLRAIPFLWSLLEKNASSPSTTGATITMQDHIVLIGGGRVGEQLIRTFERISLPYLVIDFDLGRVMELKSRDVPALYGDAGNPEILAHAQVAQARMVIITVPNDTSTQTMIVAVRSLNSRAEVLARVTTRKSISQLKDVGANVVIYPELEGGLAFVQLALEHLSYPPSEIQEDLEELRHFAYEREVVSREKPDTAPDETTHQ